VNAPVISWAKEIGTDDGFRSHQLEEAWVIIWPWHLEHPAFLAGVDQVKLAAAFKELTGKDLPLPTPTPAPTPAPPPDLAAADEDLWATLGPWTQKRHSRENTVIANAAKRWASAKGIA
jgi:hypothetical protein